MQRFTSEGIAIAYDVFGAGKPVVLVHGFASNGQVNWVETGWTDILTGAGYQAIIVDNRGHGQSEKLYDPALYPAKAMGRDIANLIDHLGLGRAVVMGYSMGARICAHVAMDAPDKVAAAVFGGLGINMIKGMDGSDRIIAGLRAPALDQVHDRLGRQFRIFADHTKSDLEALAACMASSRAAIAAEDLGRISVPVLVAVGEEDRIGGAAAPLADLLPQGEALTIPRRDHMRATGDKVFKQGVLDFLARLG